MMSVMLHRDKNDEKYTISKFLWSKTETRHYCMLCTLLIEDNATFYDSHYNVGLLNKKRVWERFLANRTTCV